MQREEVQAETSAAYSWPRNEAGSFQELETSYGLVHSSQTELPLR